MHGLWLLINLFWALVCFVSALIVAVLIALRLTGRWRIALACVAVLVAVGVGFSMMTQYWLDHERTGAFVARALRSIAADMDDTRIDEICRTSMVKIQAIGNVVGSEDAAVVDHVSYGFDKHPSFRCSCAGPEDYGDCLEGATAIYAIAAPQSDQAAQNTGPAGAAPERLYFRLKPAPWRLVRVHKKELRGGKFVDVPVWDAGVESE